MSVLQDLYDSEINFTISTLWDAGFEVKLGDPLNGFVVEETLAQWNDVVPLAGSASDPALPDSAFAKACRDKRSLQ
jgi:hypothetical protein